LHHVNSDNAANVSANNSDVLMTEYVVGEFVEIAAVGNEVVGIAVGKAGVSMASKVGNDYFEASSNEWLNVSPPNSLGFRVTMNKEKRVPAHSFSHVGKFNTI
jgi:hypothetical protein